MYKFKLFLILILLFIILFFYFNFYNNKIYNNILEKYSDNARVCFITAIYGSYESTCKSYVTQTIPTDFICFTDNTSMISNGWIIDNTPYHITHPSPLDNGTYTNSISNNKHTFNIAKYYKQAFQNIPILKKYDVIIWLDGTISIINKDTSEWILENIHKYKIIGWEHENRNGNLKAEMIDSIGPEFRYTTTNWNNQIQPYQDIEKQYDEYIKDGYDETYFKNIFPNRSNMGVWITCFTAFLNNNEDVKKFLDLWYLQTLKYTTQDQIGFPYVCQKTGLIPYTLPDDKIKGIPHYCTYFYIKYAHGK